MYLCNKFKGQGREVKKSQIGQYNDVWLDKTLALFMYQLFIKSDTNSSLFYEKLSFSNMSGHIFLV